MINASEARFRSKNQKKINDIIESADRAIENAINAGKYRCSVTIDINTEQDIRDAVEKIFKDNGYIVEIPKYVEQPWGTTSEQWGYYSYIELSWEKGV